MGYSINSTNDDFGYRVFGDRVFISSNRIGSMGLDIYEIIKIMRVLLSFIFTLLLCLTLSQGLPDYGLESQLSVSPYECIIVGDEIEITSTLVISAGIFEPPLTLLVPIVFGPLPFNYEFLNSGSYLLVGFANGWLGLEVAQCIKEITVESGELSIETIDDLDLCSGSSLEIDDILLEINGESNFFLNQYSFNVTEFPSEKVGNNINDVDLSLNVEEIELNVIDNFTGCNATSIISINLLESNTSAFFTNQSSDTLFLQWSGFCFYK